MILKKRKSNFELLRIISMFLIVLGHVTWQTKFAYNNMTLLHKVSIQSLWTGGELGVWGFTLISAYFLSASKFKVKSLRRVWGLTIFYSILIYLILLCSGLIIFNIKDAVKSIFPVLTGNYWYVSAYIGMYILVPYLNVLIKNLNKKYYQKLIILLFVIFSLLQYLKNITVVTNNNSIVDLIYIYLIGGYIRKYSIDFTKDNMKWYILTFIGSLLIMLLSILGLDIFKPESWSAFLTTSSPFEAIAGVSLFLIIKNISISYNKIINSIAKSTFAVYLIHCQAIFLPVLWQKIIRAERFENLTYTALIEILIAIGIYIIATLIDYIRRGIMWRINKNLISTKR